MLKGDPQPADLGARRESLLRDCREALDATVDEHETAPLPEPQAQVSTFRYPVLAYPQRVSSLIPEKTPRIEGQLLGIKGPVPDAGLRGVERAEV